MFKDLGERKNIVVALTILFLSYLIVLTWVLYFKCGLMGTRYQIPSYETWVWVPHLHPLTPPEGGDPSYIFYAQSFLNMALLIPFGMAMEVYFANQKKMAWFYVIFIAATFSLLYEVVQVKARLGTFDIDDAILYFLGILLGFLLARCVLHPRVKEELLDKTIRILDIIAVPMALLCLGLMVNDVFTKILPFLSSLPS